jgi:hypothetical protein
MVGIELADKLFKAAKKIYWRIKKKYINIASKEMGNISRTSETEKYTILNENSLNEINR